MYWFYLLQQLYHLSCGALTEAVTNESVLSGMLSAAASLGMILLWDVDGGLTQIDKYLYSSEDYIKVGTHNINNDI